jgi:protein-S-isoprenylcysteine O-methyltransferase Ste14
MNRKKPLPPTYFLGAIILCVALHLLVPLRQLLAVPWRLIGFVPLLLGIVLLLGSATPFAVAIALPILFDRIFIDPEEAMLKKSFGDQFAEYQNRVRRWI